MAWKIILQPVSDGTMDTGDSITQVSGAAAIPNDGTGTVTVIQPSAAQYQGLIDYIGLIKRGATTSTIESAVTGAR